MNVYAVFTGQLPTDFSVNTDMYLNGYESNGVAVVVAANESDAQTLIANAAAAQGTSGTDYVAGTLTAIPLTTEGVVVFFTGS